MIGKFGVLLIICAVAFAAESGDNEVGSDGNFIQEESTNVCQSKPCTAIAKLLQESMNKSVDPCDNFYDYVCGRWHHKTYLIPEYESYWGIESKFQRSIYKIIQGILNEPPKSSDILPVRQAKKWYGVCMDSAEREKRGIKPIESILMQTGGWPITMDPEEWSDEDFTWQNLDISYLYATGQFVFFDVETTLLNYTDGFFNTIEITPSDLPLADKLPDKFRETATEQDWSYYKSLIKRIAKVFIEHDRADVSEEMITADVEAQIEFEKELYKIKNGDSEAFLSSTLESILEEYHDNVRDLSSDDLIDFRHILRVLFDMVNIVVRDDSDTYINDPSYFSNLTILLSKTPKRVIANYMHWKFVSMAMFYVTDEMQDIFDEEMADVTYIEEKPPRWLECVKNLKMTDAISYAYATEFFTDSVEKTGLKMAENIRREIFTQIESSNWLNSAGKKAMLNKLNNMKVFLGFPDWYKNKTAVKASYKGLKVGYDYFENMINFNKYDLRKKLQLKEDENPWLVEVTEINAIYDQDTNSITIPAAHFLPRVLIPDMPESVQYGYLGFAIGHEMGHAYDDGDIDYDVDLGYNVKLSKPMLKYYFQLAECFLDQFNNYTSEAKYGDSESEESSPGQRTRGENMADTTGLQSVFRAWKKVNLKRQQPEHKLPGFEEFTDDQMFFIGFAMPWCSAMTPEYKEYMKTDSHSLPNLRVVGAVSNTEDFAKVFQCKTGRPMNPENKCNIWRAAEEMDEIRRRRSLPKRGRYARRRSIVKGR